jgi:protein-L-isoaspartate(D-aspartate) O-methyltransferase
MLDTFKHKGLRKKLVELLKEKDIKDQLVLDAIGRIPRHYFLDNAFLEFAYNDVAFPIGEGQTISQPYTVAFQSQLLKINKGDKVLEIGTGSGYQTAVLCELGAKVFSIERQQKLYQRTSEFIIKSLGYNAKLFFGDGYLGLPTFAPFKKIIVTAGAPFIPEALLQQLDSNGILVIPVNEGEGQVMLEIHKNEDGTFKKIKHGEFKFVPMLQEKSTYKK